MHEHLEAMSIWKKKIHWPQVLILLLKFLKNMAWSFLAAIAKRETQLVRKFTLCYGEKYYYCTNTHCLLLLSL